MLHLRNINPMVRAVGVMGAVSALVGGITFAQLTSNTVALSPNTLSTRSGGSGGGGNSLQIGAVSNNNNNGGNNNGNNGFGGNNSNNTNNNGGNNNNGFNNNSGNNNGGNNNFNNNNNNNTCTNTTSGSIRGFNLTGSNSLQPGVTSSPIGFCLRNTTNSPMALTVAIPDNPFRNVSSNGLQPNDVTLRITCNNGGSSTDTLDDYVTANNSSAKTLGSLSANRSTNCQTTVRLNNNANTSGSQTLPSFDIEFTGTTTS